MNSREALRATTPSSERFFAAFDVTKTTYRTSEWGTQSLEPCGTKDHFRVSVHRSVRRTSPLLQCCNRNFQEKDADHGG